MKLLGLLFCVFPVVFSEIIKGIAWFGLETQDKRLQCTWQHDVKWNLDKIQELGFNSIRIPFCAQYVQDEDWSKLDEFMNLIKNYNISVCLDFHRIYNTHQSAKPYDDHFPLDQYFETWIKVINRYKDNPKLKYIDIWNEWQGTDNYMEWNNIARQTVQLLESKFGFYNLTYIIQGTQWGGNLHTVDLEDLKLGQRLRYSIHKYWFSDQEPYEDKWDFSFGNHKDLVITGEFGYQSNQQNQIDWVIRFVKWLVSKNIRDSFFWTWSWNSGDTGGILKEDCSTIDYGKVNVLKWLWGDPHRRNLRSVPCGNGCICYGNCTSMNDNCFIIC